MYFFRSAALTTLVLTTAIVAAPIAHAQVTTYGTRTSFNAAASGLSTFTFDGYSPNGNPPQQVFTMQYASGLTIQGVNFKAPGTDTYAIDPGAGYGNPFGGHQYLYGYTGGGGVFTVTLPTGTTAFGADFSNFDRPTGDTVTALVNGQSFLFQDPSSFTNTSSFFGFTSSVPITSLSFSGGDGGPDIDNVSFGNGFPAAVPEASSAAGLSIGLAGLSLLTFRARRRVRLTV